MLTEVSCPFQIIPKSKRIHSHSIQLQNQQDVPRKRLNKSLPQAQNPYQNIPELPHIKLTQDEMNGDPIELFIKLEEKYKQFGAVKVTVNEEWRCPFQERFVDKGITTRIQYLSKLKQGKVQLFLSIRRDALLFAFEQNVEAYSFQSYQAYAINFEKTYKYKTEPTGKNIESKKQSEYWSLVTKPEYEKTNVKVQYAADLASTKYGSGFPVQTSSRGFGVNEVYQTNLFNLNNIMNSPSSLLSMANQRKEKVSGITHPWVYMGSMFSTFCWHVEDLGVNSLNYNHKGGIKTWYVIPSSHKANFDTYIKNKYCLNIHKQTLLDRITFMVDPLELIAAGIPVYKTYQRPRDYICTFFNAYHCGFSQGYNIGQAVNFISPLSIQIMKEAQKAKKLSQKRPPNVIPIDWIIYENYIRINRFKSYGDKIKKAFEQMVSDQKKQLQKVNEKYEVVKLKIFPRSKRYDKIYCTTCKQYLYLRGYQSQEDKIYCFQHLLKQKPQKSKISLLLREPDQNRKYIYDIFSSSKIYEEQQQQKRGRSKTNSFKQLNGKLSSRY